MFYFHQLFVNRTSLIMLVLLILLSYVSVGDGTCFAQIPEKHLKFLVYSRTMHRKSMDRTNIFTIKDFSGGSLKTPPKACLLLCSLSGIIKNILVYYLRFYSIP